MKEQALFLPPWISRHEIQSPGSLRTQLCGKGAESPGAEGTAVCETHSAFPKFIFPNSSARTQSPSA